MRLPTTTPCPVGTSSHPPWLRAAAHLPAMSDPAVPSGAELLDGRYVVGRRIGSGGMGVVYEAWDRQLGRSVALKTLTRTTAVGVYRLKLEYRALSDLRHPNLVRTHGLFAEHGHWFLVMDLLEGEPLSHLLERRPPVATIRELFGQIAQGLAAVHAAGRLHRDLTPANVMVTMGGR
jgi:serine/threonine protein kinase